MIRSGNLGEEIEVIEVPIPEPTRAEPQPQEEPATPIKEPVKTPA